MIQNPIDLKTEIERLRQEGLSLSEILKNLKERNIKTRSGNEMTASALSYYLYRSSSKKVRSYRKQTNLEPLKEMITIPATSESKMIFFIAGTEDAFQIIDKVLNG